MNAVHLDLDQFEKIFIYNALTDQSYLESILEYTEPHFFKDKNTKIVFSILKDIYNEHKIVPNTTELMAHFSTPEQKESLKELILSFNNIDKTYNKDLLVKNTERFLKEKSVLFTVKEISLDVQTGKVDTAKILKKVESACNISLIDDIGLDYLENIDEHCEDIQKVFKTISTGWKWLDSKIGGGFMTEGRALYVFFGVTNVGKSIFLGNMATNILNQNKTVVLISLEMPEQIYAKRISAQLSKIPWDDLKLQISPLKNFLNSYKVKNKDSKLIIKEFPTKGVTVLHIKNYLKKLVKNNIKPDAIIIDYINLIAPPTNNLNSYESVKQITEGIRALSYEFECPIISATQANRAAVSSPNPDLDKTSESMGLSHTVDAQFSIWCEEEDVELGIIHMGIVKNRFGPRQCSMHLEIDYPTLSLKEPSEFVLENSVKGKMPEMSSDFNSNIVDTLNFVEKLSQNDEKMTD